MKPHPRIRKTVKWGGLVLSTGLLGTWCYSVFVYWRGIWPTEYWMPSRNSIIVLHRGCLSFSLLSEGIPPPMSWNELPFWRVNLWYTFYRNPWKTRLTIPIATPAIGCAFLSAAAWRLDILARRRARVGHCPNCNYDRAGLTPGAVCPECGSQPAEPALQA